jgi:hypothetical protein
MDLCMFTYRSIRMIANTGKGDTKWVKEQIFVDVNGHGGVACNINPWMSYVVMQNGTDIQFWWRDSNYTKKGNSSHPIGLWQKGRQ